eukprot:5804364-Pleurochrysis_carterae.AAC.3
MAVNVTSHLKSPLNSKCYDVGHTRSKSGRPSALWRAVLAPGGVGVRHFTCAHANYNYYYSAPRGPAL